MLRLNVIRRGVALAVLVAIPPTAASADIIPGATIGAQLYRVGAERVFVRYLGSQAAYVNDVWWLGVATPTPSRLFSNQGSLAGVSPVGTERILFPFDFLASGGDEMVFAICTNLEALPPIPPLLEIPCRLSPFNHNTYFMGPGERNPDGVAHAALWTREAWLAGCAAQPDYCDPAGVASLIADPSYIYVVGFEDSPGHGIDADFNDMVIAVRGATVVPEPMTVSLVAIGLSGVAGAGWARRRRHGIQV